MKSLAAAGATYEKSERPESCDSGLGAATYTSTLPSRSEGCGLFIQGKGSPQCFTSSLITRSPRACGALFSSRDPLGRRHAAVGRLSRRGASSPSWALPAGRSAVTQMVACPQIVPIMLRLASAPDQRRSAMLLAPLQCSSTPVGLAPAVVSTKKV